MRHYIPHASNGLPGDLRIGTFEIFRKIVNQFADLQQAEADGIPIDRIGRKDVIGFMGSRMGIGNLPAIFADFSIISRSRYSMSINQNLLAGDAVKKFLLQAPCCQQIQFFIKSFL